MTPLWQPLAGLVLGLALAVLARRAHLLERGGRMLLFVSTLAVWALGGCPWGVTLVIVILLCGLSIRYRRAEKSALLRRPVTQSGEAIAVAARLAWPVVIAAMTSISGVQYFGPFAGSLAAVLADIWATEFGLLSPEPPRSFVNGRGVPAGTPGGLTAMGMIAAAAAAGLTGFIALGSVTTQALLLDGVFSRSLFWLPLATLAGGLTAVLTDSLLGGTAQALYYCEKCEAFSEDPTHHCGTPARKIRGWSWMTNEAIDAISTLVGAGMTAAAIGLLGAL